MTQVPHKSFVLQFQFPVHHLLFIFNIQVFTFKARSGLVTTSILLSSICHVLLGQTQPEDGKQTHLSSVTIWIRCSHYRGPHCCASEAN